MSSTIKGSGNREGCCGDLVSYLLAGKALTVDLFPKVIIEEEQSKVGVVLHVPRVDAQGAQV